MTTIADPTRATLTPVNPATLEPVGTVHVTTPAELDDAVVAARRAQDAWWRAGDRSRARVLRRVAQELLVTADDVAATIVAETGKPLVEAYTAEILVSLDHAGWLAAHARRVVGEQRLPLRRPYLVHKRGWVSHEPLGVVGIVSPWNFPLGVPFTQVAAAVAAGNAAVVKPSELTPLTGAWIEELYRRAGAPEGLVRVVQGPGAVVGDALVTHPGIDAVAFTGSTEVGRAIAVQAAERLRPVTLELGGKDAMLVLGDADVERSVEGALWGAFTNCGQVCSGVERVYVEAACYEPFVERLARRAAQLRVGAGADPTTDLGPLVTERQRSRVEALVADALEHGGELVTGGSRPDTGLPGWFHQPTVIVGEPRAARIRDEEVFGPVVTVVEVDNEEHGVRLANDNRYALGASVWTTDRGRARRVARALRAGSVWVNDHAYSYGVGAAPWGGRGDSGLGRTHGLEGLRSLTTVTFTDFDRGRLRPPWWYPYSGAAATGFRGALALLHGGGVGPRGRSLVAYRRGLATLARRSLGR